MADSTPDDWPEGRIVARRYMALYGNVPDRLVPFLDEDALLARLRTDGQRQAPGVTPSGGHEPGS